ncbi:MAG: hypothetical protein IJ605_06450, partial [Prevotella sp.]|nr:hypothetical protein [Prevotella sp.]
MNKGTHFLGFSQILSEEIVPPALPKVLPLEKNQIKFVFLLTYAYLWPKIGVRMKKSWIVSLALVLGSLAAVAGDDVFTVATLNVDGLPSYIGGIHINPDGPGGETWRVGGYLARKGYDIIGVQEDFNYDEELRTPLEETHYCGDWQG